MKHAVLILLLFTACASTTPDDANAPNVSLHIAQEESAPSAYLYGGAVNVRYSLSVANRTKDPVTLTRIEIRTVSSGAYTIRPTSTPINIDLAPGQEKTIPLSLWANARGGDLSAHESVTLRATAYMTGPSGPFVRLFTEYLSEQ
ncbi:MAG TPA: hypothetical protein VGQ65_03205 [Thermoanaerobaculia bacterium]|jgi:hypothetical protein|nr:hypothetical protein [Thermoanaerobaculia bacterium]